MITLRSSSWHRSYQRCLRSACAHWHFVICSGLELIKNTADFNLLVYLRLMISHIKNTSSNDSWFKYTCKYMKRASPWIIKALCRPVKCRRMWVQQGSRLRCWASTVLFRDTWLNINEWNPWAEYDVPMYTESSCWFRMAASSSWTCDSSCRKMLKWG